MILDPSTRGFYVFGYFVPEVCFKSLLVLPSLWHQEWSGLTWNGRLVGTCLRGSSCCFQKTGAIVWKLKSSVSISLLNLLVNVDLAFDVRRNSSDASGVEECQTSNIYGTTNDGTNNDAVCC